MSTLPTYPFDPSGTAATNKVSGEVHVISPPNWRDFYFIIPKCAPFFRESMKITHVPSGRVLTPNVDFVASHHFRSASRATAKGVYGSISFMDKALTGVVTLEYQTVGGEWVVDEAKALQILTDVLTNPRVITWEQVAELPARFPPIDHEWDVDDLVGMSEVVEKLQRIELAILAKGGGSIDNHLTDKTNPHNVTKGQVGLGSVQNYPIASSEEAAEGLVNTAYMTPLRVKEAILALALPVLQQHINDDTNPHNVTKAQVGLGNVDNYATATRVEAEAGTANNRFLTPLRMKEALNALHADNKNNPHQTNKAHVGLGLVQNYPIASSEEAAEGETDQAYMTPLKTRIMVAALASESVAGHLADKTNPHNVTKTQVGLGNVPNYPAATSNDAADPLNSTTLMTPSVTHQLLSDLAGGVSGDFAPQVDLVENFDNTVRWCRLANVEYGTPRDCHLAVSFHRGAAGGALFFISMNGAAVDPLSITQINKGAAGDVGFTTNDTDGYCELWVKLAEGETAPLVTLLSNNFGEVVKETTYVVVEPTGIEYVTPMVLDPTDLENRMIAAFEAAIDELNAA